VPWRVEIVDEFLPEFQASDEAVQDKILAYAKLLQQFGPQLSVPGWML